MGKSSEELIASAVSSEAKVVFEVDIGPHGSYKLRYPADKVKFDGALDIIESTARRLRKLRKRGF